MSHNHHLIRLDHFIEEKLCRLYIVNFAALVSSF